MSDCKHEHTTYADGMISIAEPPYDGTDFWWSITCEDCGNEIAEGDGYSKPPRHLMEEL